MVSHSSPQSATRHRWHELLERYTPNGASGRLLIAIPSGSVGVYSLIWSVAMIITSSILWLPLLLVLAGVSLGVIIFALMMIWPVYLSLIGNVESAKAYPQTSATPSEKNHDDSIAVVKRQYAAGNISEEEFEQRVENLLHADARSQPRTRSHRNAARDTIQEID
jgi:uncharacterized membrane protein